MERNYRILKRVMEVTGVGCDGVNALCELSVITSDDHEQPEVLPGEVAYAICMARMENPEHEIMVEIHYQSIKKSMQTLSQHNRKSVHVRHAVDGLLNFSNELVNRFHLGQSTGSLEVNVDKARIRQGDDPTEFEVDFTLYGPSDIDMLSELMQCPEYGKQSRIAEIFQQKCTGIMVDIVKFIYLDQHGKTCQKVFYNNKR